jgi:hypothetical protein
MISRPLVIKPYADYSQSWVLLESVRRTVIMGYSFICLFTVLKAEERESPSFPSS